MLPSELVFQMIDFICKRYSGGNLIELSNAPLYQLFYLYVEAVKAQRAENEEIERSDSNHIDNNVKTITRPATISIRNGGWY